MAVHHTQGDSHVLLDRLLAVLEDWQWSRLLFHLAAIIHGTGWGEVTITLQAGRMHKISSTMTEHPRRPDDP